MPVMATLPPLPWIPTSPPEATRLEGEYWTLLFLDQVFVLFVVFGSVPFLWGGSSVCFVFFERCSVFVGGIKCLC